MKNETAGGAGLSPGPRRRAWRSPRPELCNTEQILSRLPITGFAVVLVNLLHLNWYKTIYLSLQNGILRSVEQDDDI